MEPDSMKEHQRVFNAQIRFRQTQNALVFDIEVVHRPLGQSNAHLLSIVEKMGEKLLEKLQRTGCSVSDTVRACLKDAYLRVERADMSVIARRMGKSN